MRVRATTAGRHLFGPDLYVQGRLEVQWQPGGLWHKISVDNYAQENWQLTLLVWQLASLGGSLEFEHVDFDVFDAVVPQNGEDRDGTNAPTRD